MAARDTGSIDLAAVESELEDFINNLPRCEKTINDSLKLSLITDEAIARGKEALNEKTKRPLSLVEKLLDASIAEQVRRVELKRHDLLFNTPTPPPDESKVPALPLPIGPVDKDVAHAFTSSATYASAAPVPAASVATASADLPRVPVAAPAPSLQTSDKDRIIGLVVYLRLLKGNSRPIEISDLMSAFPSLVPFIEELVPSVNNDPGPERDGEMEGETN